MFLVSFPNKLLSIGQAIQAKIIPPLHKAVLQGDAVEFLFSRWCFNCFFCKHAAQQRPDAQQCKVSAESLCTTATLPKSVIVQVTKLG